MEVRRGLTFWKSPMEVAAAATSIEKLHGRCGGGGGEGGGEGGEGGAGGEGGGNGGASVDGVCSARLMLSGGGAHNRGAETDGVDASPGEGRG